MHQSRIEAYPVFKRSSLWTFCQSYMIRTKTANSSWRKSGVLHTKVGSKCATKCKLTKSKKKIAALFHSFNIQYDLQENWKITCAATKHWTWNKQSSMRRFIFEFWGFDPLGIIGKSFELKTSIFPTWILVEISLCAHFSYLLGSRCCRMTI